MRKGCKNLPFQKPAITRVTYVSLHPEHRHGDRGEVANFPSPSPLPLSAFSFRRVPRPSRLFSCQWLLPSQNGLHNACTARSLPPESSCQAEVPPYPPLPTQKKGPAKFCIPSPVWADGIQHLTQPFPRSGLFPARGRWAPGRMSLLLAAPTTQSLLLPPLSSLRCKAGCCGHPPSCLLLKAPFPPCPLLPGLPVELFFSLCISQRSKADASILSGDGDVSRMARGLQAGVGRFPAISQASVPFLSHHWLVPEAWTEAWGRDGEKKRMGRDMLTPEAAYVPRHPARMQACSQLPACCSLLPMKGAGIQPCPVKAGIRDQSGPGPAS